MKRVQTGIHGFDEVTQGGFVNNSVNLLSGGTGTGKTLFCLQFLWNSITKYNENSIYISFEESEENLKEDAKVFKWNFDNIKGNNKRKCVFCYFPPYSIRDFESSLIEKIEKTKSKRVVIDSISSLAMSLEDDFERRKGIYRLVDQLKKLDCTSILTSEIAYGSSISADGIGKLSRDGIVEFVCDSVTTCHYAGLGGLSDRAIRIIKMRRTKHVRSPLPMEITNEGVRVFSKRKEYM